MIQLSWNCQGLGNSLTVLYLKEQIRSKSPSVIYLMEIKMSNHRLISLRRQCGFQQGFSVDPVGTAAGLSVWWKTGIDVTIRDYCKHWIDATVLSVGECFHARCTWLTIPL